MSSIAPLGPERAQPDLAAIAKTTAVVVSVVALSALIVTLLALAGRIFLVGFLGALVAILFDTIARPLVVYLHMKRKHAFALVVFVALVLAGTGVLVAGGKAYAQVDQLVARSSETYTKLQAQMAELPPPLGSGKASGEAPPPSGDKAAGPGADSGSSSSSAPQMVSGAFKIAGTMTEVASSFLLMLLMSLFFGYAPEEYVDALIAILPARLRGQSWSLATAVFADLKQWLFGQMTTMCVTGTFVLTGLLIAGVKLAPVLGLVAGLCNFVPYLGAFIAPIPGVLTVLAEDGPGKLPVVLGIYAAAEFLEGWVVTPFVQKKQSNIPPALLVFFQALMGLVAGPLGVVISTPLLVIIMTCVRELLVEPAHQ